ncbi:MAG: serine/threonine protein kinase [Clostridium sp.]|nr:serine/threonine protein kinase [Clostridium sp.]
MIGKEILNYRIVKLIGEGGMGAVYLAEHKYIRQQKVAIKVLHNGVVNDYTREKLTQEAEHLASLDHPNIVKLINYHIDDEGNIYLIEEFADGVTLEKFINEVNGLVVEDRVCALFEPILDGVGYAHQKGIIHRDLKPTNIIITKEGTPKILDFGIATIMNEDNDEEKFVVGTPSYMSPEQVRGQHLDQRSDIYALGVILHQMMTGNAPYDTTTMSEHEINEKVVNEPLAPMKSFYKYVSPETQKVVDKATAKNPDDRYQNCNDFRKSLHRAIYPPKTPRWVWWTAAAVLCVLIGGGLWWWDYTRTKVTYYKDYTEVWGEPVGVGKLSSSDYSHIHRAYRFETSRGKVRRMTHVNSIGTIIPDNESERKDRTIDALYTYTPEGKVARVKVLDHNGRVQYVKSYSENLKTVVFQFDDEHGTEKTLGADMLGATNAFDNRSMDNRGKISRYHQTYDDNGYVTRTEYAGLYNMRVSDGDNIYGREYIRDDKGRIAEERYLGLDGQPISTRWGLGKKRFKYDDNDNMTEVVYLTVDDEPSIEFPSGTAVYQLDYDKYGNVAEVRLLNGDGELYIPARYGYSFQKTSYDDKGYINRQEHYGPDQQLINLPDGYAIFETECDDNGFFNVMRFYDTEGNLTRTKSNAAITRFVNDAKGNQLTAENFDENDKPLMTKEAFFRSVCEYDTLGNMISAFYYDTDGKLTATPGFNGGAGALFEYDDFNRIVKRTNLNSDSVVAPSDLGITVDTRTFDARGNMTSYAFFEDVECKKPQENINGIAGSNMTYDDNGNLSMQTFFGKDGQLKFDEDHVAIYRCTYDDRGNKTSVRYFDTADKPVLSTDRYAGKIWEYDSIGNSTMEKYIGVDGTLAVGYLYTRYKYDKDNNVIEEALFDRGDKPGTNNWGYHIKRMKYDSRRQCTEESYFDKEDKPTLHKINRFATQRMKYDNLGNVIEVAFFGTDGKPTDCNSNYSIHRSEYDAMGRVIHQTFYDTEGKPTDPSKMVPEGFSGYDNNGNINYVASGDGKGNLIFNPQIGACIMRFEHDPKGRVLTQTFFDKDDKPTVSTVNGFHKLENKYDVAGNILETAYFDADGKPMLKRPEGYHKLAKTYDELNRPVSETYYGVNGSQITPAGSNFSKITYQYTDETQTAKRLRAYTPSGALAMTLIWNGSQWVIDSSTIDEPQQDWQAMITGMNAECPYDFGEDAMGIILTSCKVTGAKSCQLNMQTPESRYDMSDELYQAYIALVNEFGSNFKSSVPSGVSMTLILKDKRGRELFNKTF